MRPSLHMVVLLGLSGPIVAQDTDSSGWLEALPEVFAIPDGPEAREGTQVSDAAVGDVDGDGLLDAVVTLADASDQLLGGDGTGGIELVDDSALSRFAGPSRSVALGDLDNDGLLDVFVAAGHLAPNQVYVHVDGGGALVPLADLAPTDPTVTDVESSYGVALADLDDDGRLDAVVANLDAASVIYANVGADGAAGFVRRPDHVLDRAELREAGGAKAVVVDDVDVDGDDDVLLTGRDESDFVYLARGESEFDFLKITTGNQP
jgi:hypothetical protein